MSNRITFPQDFNWGVATTAIQIEGGLDDGGRGPSMWPDFARTPGNIYHDDTPAGSAASYHNLQRDLDALERLGVTSYNFSTSWPRLIPEGAGRVNQKGVDYYNRLIDGLLERGIDPDLSLYDWDLPLKYSQNEGWGKRDLTDRFNDYVDVLIRNYGDRVTKWMTFNEISTQAKNGYKQGNHAPGYQDNQLFLRAYHHLMVAHGRAVQMIREQVDGAEITVVDNLLQYYPKTMTAADRNAAARQQMTNDYFLLEALFNGRLHQPFVDHYEQQQGCNFDHIHPGDLAQINQKFDQFGVNYFTSFSAADDPKQPGKAELVSASPGPQSPFGWTIDPVGMLDALRDLKRKYTKDLPIFVGECGIGGFDYPSPDGAVHDPKRIKFLYQHLEQLHVAMQEGIEITGFYIWSLMDNFEWDNGYNKRMGLYYTQYNRPEEYLIKDSGKWFAELIRTGELRDIQLSERTEQGE